MDYRVTLLYYNTTILYTVLDYQKFRRRHSSRNIARWTEVDNTAILLYSIVLSLLYPALLLQSTPPLEPEKHRVDGALHLEQELRKRAHGRGATD